MFDVVPPATRRTGSTRADGVMPFPAPECSSLGHGRQISSRANIVEVARWGSVMPARFHYAEVRPIPLRRALPAATDCSGFRRTPPLRTFRPARPEPNGLGYIGQGLHRNAACGTAAPSRPRRGSGRFDLVVWGPLSRPSLRLVLIEPGDDPPYSSSHALVAWVRFTRCALGRTAGPTLDTGDVGSTAAAFGPWRPKWSLTGFPTRSV